MPKKRVLLLGRGGDKLQSRGERLRQAGFVPFLTEDLETALKVCREVQFSAAVVGQAIDAQEKTHAIRLLRQECRLPVVLITEGKTLTGVKADAYISCEEETLRLEGVLTELMSNSEQEQS
jgi:hypothetical protein